MAAGRSLGESIGAVARIDATRGGLWFLLEPRLRHESGWYTISETVAALPTLLNAYEGGEEPRSRLAVQGSLLLEAWAWTALTPALHLLFYDGTVLELGDPSVQVFAPPGRRPVALAVDADGPLGRTPRRARPSDPAGIDLLIGPVVAFHQPLIELIHTMSGRSKKALWRSVRDRLASAILASGEAFRQPQLADAMLARMLETGRVTGGVPRIVRRPGARPSLERGGCCLWWRTGAAACDGCPITVARR